MIFASLPYQLRIIAKESLARFPVLGWHLKRGGHLFVDRAASRSRRHPEALARARVRRAVADHLRGGHAQPGRARRAVQGGQLPAGDRGRAADRAARGHRHAAGDAERPAADRAGRRRARRPRSDPAAGARAPTIRGRQGARRPRSRHRRATGGSQQCRSHRRAAPKRGRCTELRESGMPSQVRSAMHVTAIIAAGGRGQRFGGALPKQLLSSAAGRCSSAASRRSSRIRRSTRSSSRCRRSWPRIRRRICAATPKPLRIVAGGARRQDSVVNAFRARRRGERRRRDSRRGAAVCERRI